MQRVARITAEITGHDGSPEQFATVIVSFVDDTEMQFVIHPSKVVDSAINVEIDTDPERPTGLRINLNDALVFGDES